MKRHISLQNGAQKEQWQRNRGHANIYIHFYVLCPLISWTITTGEILAVRAHCALLLHNVLPKKTPGTPLLNAPKFKSPQIP